MDITGSSFDPGSCCSEISDGNLQILSTGRTAERLRPKILVLLSIVLQTVAFFLRGLQPRWRRLTFFRNVVKITTEISTAERTSYLICFVFAETCVTFLTFSVLDFIQRLRANSVHVFCYSLLFAAVNNLSLHLKCKLLTKRMTSYSGNVVRNWDVCAFNLGLKASCFDPWGPFIDLLGYANQMLGQYLNVSHGRCPSV